jgi:hypothetical protein
MIAPWVVSVQGFVPNSSFLQYPRLHAWRFVAYLTGNCWINDRKIMAPQSLFIHKEIGRKGRIDICHAWRAAWTSMGRVDVSKACFLIKWRQGLLLCAAGQGLILWFRGAQ